MVNNEPMMKNELWETSKITAALIELSENLDQPNQTLHI